jgi:hypothetical protein
MDYRPREINNLATKLVDGDTAKESFYQGDDPFVELARSHRRGSRSSIRTVDDVLDESSPTSTYGHILRTGVNHFRAIDSFVTTDSDESIITSRLP